MVPRLLQAVPTLLSLGRGYGASDDRQPLSVWLDSLPVFGPSAVTVALLVWTHRWPSPVPVLPVSVWVCGCVGR